MKQTNSAIKFLMAQYRAVFINAQIKMFLAAAPAAIMLSMNLAYAAPGNNIWDLEDFSTARDDQTNTLAPETVTKESTIYMGDSSAQFDQDGFMYSGFTGTTQTTTVISGSTAQVTITGAKDKHLAVNGLTLRDGAKLVINNDETTNTTLYGYDQNSQDAPSTDANFGPFKVYGSTIEANRAALKFHNVNLYSGSIITLGGMITADKTAGFTDADWTLYSNISATFNQNGGVFSSQNSTINLNHESNVIGSHGVEVSGGSVNFNGKVHDDGYATANLISSDATSGTVTINGDSKLNVNGDGAIYANKINLTNASATIASDKKLFLDGMWTNNTAANAGSHAVSAITMNGFKVDGEGTLEIGNNGSQSTVEITHKVEINSALANHAEITVTGENSSLQISSDKLASRKGVFASPNGKLLLKDKATLTLTDEEAVDLGNFIYANDNAASNSIAVSGEASIAVKNAQITNGFGIKGSNKLHIVSTNVELGTSETNNKNFALGLGTDGSISAEKVTFKSKNGSAFGLDSTLNLATLGAGNITGAVTVGTANGAGLINITEGDYTLEQGKDLVIKSGAGTDSVGLQLTNSSLKLTGKLETTAAKGIIKLSSATLDAADASSYKIGADTIKLDGASTVILDSTDWFTFENAGADLVKFKTDFAADAVSGGALSTIKLTGANSAMTMAQFEKLQSGTSFGGFFDGIKITDQKAKTSMSLTEVKTGLGSDFYKDTQVNSASSDKIEKLYAVGNLNVTDGSNVSISGGTLTLINGYANGANGLYVKGNDGSAGKVTFEKANSTLALQGTGTIAAVDSSVDKTGTFVVGALDGSKVGNVTVEGNIGETQPIGELTVFSDSSLTVKGNTIKTYGFHLQHGSKLDAKDASISVSAQGNSSGMYLKGDLIAKELILTNNNTGGELIIAGGANVNIDRFVGTNGTLNIGSDGPTGLGATVAIGKLDLTTSDLFIDPDFGKKASVVTAHSLSGLIGGAHGAGTIDGSIYIGKNSLFGVGFDNTDESMAELYTMVGKYLISNGGFDENGKIHNALVLNDTVTLKNNAKIVVDSNLTDENHANAGASNGLTLGDNAILIITEKAFDEGADVAIKFSQAANATVSGGRNSKLVLVGDYNKGNLPDDLFLAEGTGGTTGTVSGSLNFEAAGGLIVGQTSGAGIDKGTVIVDPEAIAAMRSQVSSPVGDMIVDYVDGKLKDNSGEDGYEFLVDTISNQGYAKMDAVYHAATYAGAQQAAVAAVTTMADAVGSRVGSFGVETNAISATGSNSKGGVWLTPMYKSVEADGFDAQGVSYGSDVDLSGVAFGADMLKGQMRYGAVFNIGSGDSEGKGHGAGLKDEFEYYGVGIYTAMGFSNLTVVADASFNVISHKVSGFDLNGEADTTAVTMGLTGQYTFATPVVDVTPHVGARFIRLNTDAYKLKAEDGILARTDFDVQNVFSVPVGVTLSKAFEMGGWSLAPCSDFSVTFNTGDTEVTSTTLSAGLPMVKLSTEVMDELNYGVNVGLAAQYGSLGGTIGVNYVGSENIDSFGVNANVRYSF